MRTEQEALDLNVPEVIKKVRGVLETFNDLDGEIYNLFKVIRERPEELIRTLEATPWSRQEYMESYERDFFIQSDVEMARLFLVKMWQGIGSKTADRTGWRNNIKGVNGNVARFHTSLPTEILEVSERLKCKNGKIVQIENQDMFQLIERYNRENVLMYIDPPYVRSTRNNRIYKHEFTDDDHRRLLELCNKSKAKIVISGYDCPLYQDMLKSWNHYTTQCTTESGKTKEESIWLNYELENKLF